MGQRVGLLPYPSATADGTDRVQVRLLRQSRFVVVMRTFAENQNQPPQLVPSGLTRPTVQLMSSANNKRLEAKPIETPPSRFDFSRTPIHPPASPHAAIGPRLGSLIERSRPSGRLPAAVHSTLRGIPGHTLEKIRIHDDSAAHEAAHGLRARAFTIGPSIYFGQNEYQPATTSGLRVLAHEAAHAHQQADATLPPTKELSVSSPSSREEVDAERFADALGTGAPVAPPVQKTAGSVARLMRLEFVADDTPPAKPLDIAKTLHPVQNPDGFSFGLGWEGNLFSWESAVSVHGTPDKNSEWRAGMIQLMKDYWLNVWWDNGESCGGSFPMERIKDSKQGLEDIRAGAPELPWFNAAPGYITEPFTSDAQTGTIKMEDSPGATIPYRQSGGGFNFGATFVTYISAYNNGPDVANPEDRYRHLKHVYWQTMLAGGFDGKEKRYWTTDGGLTQVLDVRDGVRDDLPPKVDGPTGYDQIILPINQCLNPKYRAPKITPGRRREGKE